MGRDQKIVVLEAVWLSIWTSLIGSSFILRVM